MDRYCISIFQSRPCEYPDGGDNIDMKTCLLILTVPMLIVGLALTIESSSSKTADGPALVRARIDSLYDVEINGCKQKILVQTSDLNNPLLLYLHGGPGSSIMMMSHVYSNGLKDHFILVNWDQRGTALSFHEGMDATKISEDQIRADALALVKFLLKTFHKKTIYLIGHSFGSVIGLQLVADHPELFSAYIGVGQVINWNKSVDITYKWLHDTLEAAGDTSGLRRIESDQFPSMDLVTKYGGHHRLSISLDSLITSSPYYFEGYLDLLRKGRELSQREVEKNHPSRSAAHRSTSAINVPLYFFEGIHDHVIACAPQLVVEYCKSVKAPKAEVVWFYDSAHYVCVEEPGKFQDELIRIGRQNGTGE